GADLAWQRHRADPLDVNARLLAAGDREPVAPVAANPARLAQRLPHRPAIPSPAGPADPALIAGRPRRGPRCAEGTWSRHQRGHPARLLPLDAACRVGGYPEALSPRLAQAL